MNFKRPFDGLSIKIQYSFNPFFDRLIQRPALRMADGDTITVPENRTQYRIRLFGIDAPERRQDFSNRARQFVANLVFDKQVQIVKQDVDRYGRIVGVVYVSDVCVDEELVRNGLANMTTSSKINGKMLKNGQKRRKKGY